MSRFFVSPNQIEGQFITIIGENAKHIRTVLRCKAGDSVIVCDGQGTDYHCVITECLQTIQLEVKDKQKSIGEPSLSITLYQGIPKGEKMEWIIQKCVELGVTKIVPVMTERVIVKLEKKEEKKIARWQKIAEAAAKQSERGVIPPIGSVMPYKEAIQEAAQLDGAIIPYEKEEGTTLKDIVKNIRGKRIGVFIGPEGGFTEEEIQFAEKNGIVSITLGKRILRTETAGMTAAAILLYEFDT